MYWKHILHIKHWMQILNVKQSVFQILKYIPPPPSASQWFGPPPALPEPTPSPTNIRLIGMSCSLVLAEHLQVLKLD